MLLSGQLGRLTPAHFRPLAVAHSGRRLVSFCVGEAWQAVDACFERFCNRRRRGAAIHDGRRDTTRARRLITERRPELASPTMMNWAAYLRKEAQEANCEVLDTTGVSLEFSVEQVRRYLEQ